MTQLAFHPLATIFPLLEGEPFAALVHDIATQGVQEPIVLYQGAILDGRNRARACEEARVTPQYREYTGDDPLAYVVSKNLHRRHLSESQRAMMADALATMRQGARTDLASIEAKSQEQAADLLQVSRSSVQRAHAIHTQGAPEIQQAVVAGTLTVSAAEPLTALPREDQLAALQEAQHEATGQKTTATQTRAVVRRRQEATTVTPERDGHPKAAEATRAVLPKRLAQLFDPLEALATVPDLEQLLLDISPDWYDRIDQYLAPAFATLHRLRTFRKEHQHEATAVRVQPRAPQRVRQPTKRETRRKTTAKTRQPAQPTPATTQTVRSQPTLLLAVLRTAHQPLTIKDLRQISGVDGRRLKRNVARLVAQGKMQETSAGYVVASTEGAKGSSGRDASHAALVATSRDDDTTGTARSEG